MEMDYNHSNPYKCRLRVSVPSGKERRFQKIVSPLMKWIDPSFQMLQIVNDNESTWKTHVNNNQRPANSEENVIMVPAMSIMLFLYEHGTMSAVNIQNCFKKKPWRFHHKVELHSKRTPDRAVANQEFYEIADDMPLWSVCPVHCGNEHFRVLIHVRNFQRMMEFYRSITDMEIESNKPGFCIFQMYSQPGLDIQLALKQSKNIRPYPVHNSCLIFQIKDIDVLRTFLDCEIIETGERTFLVQDPDGNYVQLQEHISSGVTTDYDSLEILERCDTSKESKFDSHGYVKDIRNTKDIRSSSDSQDSGRCSDSDIWASEVEPIKSRYTSGHKTFNMGNRKVVHELSADSVSGYYSGRELQPDNYSQWEGQTQLTFDTTMKKINSEFANRTEEAVFI